MPKGVKVIIGIIVIILIIWGLMKTSSRSAAPTVTKEPIKIGVVAPLTGPGAIFGNSLVRGLELARQDLNDSPYRYELVVQDDGTNPGQSASAAQKLIQTDRVQVIITATSGTGHAVAPIASAAKVLHVCVACTDITIADGVYNFTNSILGEDEARVWLTEAKRRGTKTVALLTQNQAGVNAAADQVKQQAPGFGLTIVYEDRFDGSARDFKTALAKLKQISPDLIYLRSFPPAMDILGEELKVQKIASVSTGAGAFMLVANPSIFDGLWYVDAGLKDLNFVQRFHDAYPEVRFNALAAPYAYDTLMMVAKSFESGSDAPGYFRALNSYSGKVGLLTKDEKGSFRSQPQIWTIKNGQPAAIN